MQPHDWCYFFHSLFSDASEEFVCHQIYVLFTIIDSIWLVIQCLRDHNKHILIHVITVVHEASSYAVFCNTDSLLILKYDLLGWIMRVHGRASFETTGHKCQVIYSELYEERMHNNFLKCPLSLQRCQREMNCRNANQSTFIKDFPASQCCDKHFSQNNTKDAPLSMLHFIILSVNSVSIHLSQCPLQAGRGNLS